MNFVCVRVCVVEVRANTGMPRTRIYELSPCSLRTATPTPSMQSCYLFLLFFVYSLHNIDLHMNMGPIHEFQMAVSLVWRVLCGLYRLDAQRVGTHQGNLSRISHTRRRACNKGTTQSNSISLPFFSLTGFAAEKTRGERKKKRLSSLIAWRFSSGMTVSSYTVGGERDKLFRVHRIWPAIRQFDRSSILRIFPFFFLFHSLHTVLHIDIVYSQHCILIQNHTTHIHGGNFVSGRDGIVGVEWNATLLDSLYSFSGIVLYIWQPRVACVVMHTYIVMCLVWHTTQLNTWKNA